MSDIHLQLQSRAELRADGEDRLVVKTTGAAVRYQSPSAGARTLLSLLAEEGGETDALIAAAQDAEPNPNVALLYYTLNRLEQQGLLALSVRQDGHQLATLEPMTARFRRARLTPGASSDEPGHAPAFRLSRFAWLRRDRNNLLLECALGQCRLRLHDARLAAVVSALATPQTLDGLGRLMPMLDPVLERETLNGFLILLASAQALFPCDAEGRIPEDDDPVLRHWDSHDLLFHSRSRQGRHDAPSGATYHLADELPHAPAIKPAGPGDRTRLSRPATTPADPGFFAVLEARRSIRDVDERPLNLDQLGHLLWFVARVQEHRPANPDDAREYEMTKRPVAGGGAMHELELYLTVTRCDGLEAGLYRYDPLAHELEWIRAPNADTQGLIDDAMAAAALSHAPDVLITLAARFARMSWKYQGMSYAATLKYVGVLYQQLYLVATALGLAPCALGTGNADRFATAAGTHYYEETSVGEFALSSRPTADPQPSTPGSQ